MLDGIKLEELKEKLLFTKSLEDDRPLVYLIQELQVIRRLDYPIPHIHTSPA